MAVQPKYMQMEGDQEPEVGRGRELGESHLRTSSPRGMVTVHCRRGLTRIKVNSEPGKLHTVMAVLPNLAATPLLGCPAAAGSPPRWTLH